MVPSWFLSNISNAALKAASSSGRNLSAMIEEVQQAASLLCLAAPATQKSIMHCCQAYRKPRPPRPRHEDVHWLEKEAAYIVLASDAVRSREISKSLYHAGMERALSCFLFSGHL